MSDPNRVVRLEAIQRRVDAAVTPSVLDDLRCAVCGWRLAESADKGCVRGNCALRPFPDNYYDAARANAEYGGILCTGPHDDARNCPVHRPALPRIDPDITFLLAEVSRLAGAVGTIAWQPIETAPKDGAEILLTDGHYKRTGYWATRIGAWSMDAAVLLNAPTHWLRLPALQELA